MKRGARSYTVDFYEEPHPIPQVGQAVREVGSDSVVRGYLRIVAVRQVRVRVSRGEKARYRLMVERHDKMPPGGVAFTVYSYPARRKPKPKTPTALPGLDDPFSPLLPP